MTKSELRKMIREEVRRVMTDELQDIVDEQIYTILPGFIKEALGSVVQKASRQAPKQAPRQPNRPIMQEATGNLPEHEKRKMAAAMGYGDLVAPAHAPTPQVVAGVPMAGGLLEQETSYGQAETRDYTVGPEGGAVMQPGMGPVQGAAVETAPAFNAMPEFLINAVSKAKQVYEQAEVRNNWRPGKPR